MPFIAMWVFVYHLQKEILRLIKKNKELKETYKQLEKAYDRTEDLKELCFYRYLFAKNDVDLCKKKISCSDYLSSRRHFEDKIEFYIKKLLAKGVQ